MLRFGYLGHLGRNVTYYPHGDLLCWIVMCANKFANFGELLSNLFLMLQKLVRTIAQQQKGNFIVKTILKFIACLGLAFIIGGTSYAETIIVDQSGGGDYTTIQEAINNAAEEGDIIKVGPGVYRESINLKNAVQLIGAGPNFSFIDATHSQVNASGIEVKTTLQTFIYGFSITADGVGINMGTDSVKCKIFNCIISGCTTGINARRSGAQVDIVNSTIILNMGNGIHSSGSSMHAKGCIIAFNSGKGLSSDSSSESSTYNCVYENTVINYDDYRVSPISAGTGDFSEDPKFIDKNSSNYALKSDSPCLNKGIIGAVFNDPDGTRNDMGAYAGPDSAAFWPYVIGGPVVSELNVYPASVPKGGKITINAKGLVR